MADMYPPIMVLEACTPETNWNDNTMLAICCDFLQMLMVEDRSIYEKFQTYVIERMEEDCNGTIEE